MKWSLAGELSQGGGGPRYRSFPRVPTTSKDDEIVTAAPILNIQSSDNELSKQTVFIKLHLGLLGNSRKVSSPQVAVDADWRG
jgi:hypothetical protein